jgi:hypothetical protein
VSHSVLLGLILTAEAKVNFRNSFESVSVFNKTVVIAISCFVSNIKVNHTIDIHKTHTMKHKTNTFIYTKFTQ